MNLQQTINGLEKVDQMHVYHKGILVAFHEDDQRAICTALDILLSWGFNVDEIKLELKWEKKLRVK